METLNTDNLDTKTCKRCKQDLPIASYWTSAHNKDGYQSYCKACYKAYEANHRPIAKLLQKFLSQSLDDVVAEWRKQNQS